MRVDAGVQVNSIDVVYMIGSTVGQVATSTIRHIAKRFHAGLIRTAQSIRSAPTFLLSSRSCESCITVEVNHPFQRRLVILGMKTSETNMQHSR